jgi:hypothetical protein
MAEHKLFCETVLIQRTCEGDTALQRDRGVESRPGRSGAVQMLLVAASYIVCPSHIVVTTGEAEDVENGCHMGVVISKRVGHLYALNGL